MRTNTQQIIYTMRKICFWLFLTGMCFKFEIAFADEDCQFTKPPKLQIVFVIDEVMKLNNDIFFDCQTQSASYLIDLFKNNNFQAEYAVAGFVDYPDTAVPRVITNQALCYFLIQELTDSKEKVVAALSKDYFSKFDTNATNFREDHAQSLTTAMLFAAVDKKLKWNPGFYDKQGNIVRKIMIPMVYKDYTRTLKAPGNRKPPKADGTDTCETALIPEFEQLDQVLFDNQFFVVNSILKFEYFEIVENLKVEEIYAELFENLYVPYYQAPLPEAGKYLDKPSECDAKKYGKHLYDIILKEVMSCDWEDPLGYNTLGL